jgi:hypothetical protein
MTRIAVREILQVVLVLRLGHPEGSGGLRSPPSRPEPRRIDVGDGVVRDPFFFVAGGTPNGAIRL